MKKGLYFAAFIAGAAIGSAVTWCCVKKKYEKIAQEEINSVKEVFAKRDSTLQTREGHKDSVRLAAEQAKEKPDVMAYNAILQKRGYVSYSDGGAGEKENIMKQEYPRVILPEEFGEIEDYETISLTYYADGILADDDDEIINDVEEIVGDALDHFGEYEDDSVFVRCDRRKSDYEILLDQRSFSEVAGSKPRQVEV